VLLGFVPLWLRISYIWFHRVTGARGAHIAILLETIGIVAIFGGALLQYKDNQGLGSLIQYGGILSLAIAFAYGMIAFVGRFMGAVRSLRR
jgi:hypothetical protein